MVLAKSTGHLGLGVVSPISHMHVSSLSNNQLFRTDGNQSLENRWQLFTGTGSTTQTERFRIRTFANGFDTWLERTQAGSEADIRLLTAQIEVRARLKRLGDFCELNGEALSDIVQFGDGTNVNIFNNPVKC